MKKTTALFMAVLMALSLCACKGAESAKETVKETGLKVGYGQVSITPETSLPLAGYGNTMNRMSEGYMDELFATCIAVQDAAGETALFITTDTLSFYDNLLNMVRPSVSVATSVPQEGIVLCATHTHSAPDMNADYAGIVEYKDLFTKAVVEAGKAAMADLSPATVETASVDTENLTFVRHYLMNDGTYYGPNFGSSASGFKAHERDADPEMQLIRFARAAKDKKDVLMVNWQTHPLVASTTASSTGAAARNMMSADFVGPMRDYIYESTDTLVAFYQGAAGNLNPRSSIAAEQEKVPTEVEEYGKTLGQYAIEAMKNMETVSVGTIVSKQTKYKAEFDHSENHLVEYAKPVADMWAQTGNFSACLELGREYGVMGPYHAGAIIRRSKVLYSVKEMEINAIAIGDVAFVTAPYEMFCQNGQQIKDGSPYATTFVITCANGHNSYIAADEAFEFGSYEVHARNFVRGTAEGVVAELISMLETIKG